MTFSPSKLQKRINNQQPASTLVGPKSPFKTIVKQIPTYSDLSVNPMETETNVKDDDDEIHNDPNLFASLSHVINHVNFPYPLFDKKDQELCESCALGQSTFSPFRLIVIDCRLSMLQREFILPSTFGF